MNEEKRAVSLLMHITFLCLCTRKLNADQKMERGRGKQRTHNDVLVCDPVLFEASKKNSACQGTRVPLNFSLC